MKKIPVLYKRTRTGAIQYWEIKTSTKADGTSSIIKTSGQYGTEKPLEHVKEITKGKNIGKKNETTPQQQAEAEALSQWKKKQDDGYKSIDDLGIEHHTKLHGGIHPELGWKHKAVFYKNFKEVLEAALPKFNSDAQGNVKPMLAKAVNWDKVTYPCYVQPKMDGVRCLAISDGQSVTFLSRGGKPFSTLGHIGEEILKKAPGETFILDGEVYSEELTFQSIVSAVKKQSEESKLLKLKVYDMVTSGNQMKRKRKLQDLLIHSGRGFENVHCVDFHVCLGKEEVLAYFSEFLSKGYEGAMVRLTNGEYDQGQRSSSLLKVKEFDSNEYDFIGYELGQRGVEDLIAVCRNGGKVFRAKMQGTVADKEEEYNSRPPEPGTPLTVKHFGYTDDGLPRFPIGVAFRDYE